MSSKQSLAKLSLMIRLLSKAHSFLVNGTSATKRELYYQFLLSNQWQLDQCVVGVSSILDAAPWELGILSTAKGIVAGDLAIVFSDEKQISCKIGLYLLAFLIFHWPYLFPFPYFRNCHSKWRSHGRGSEVASTLCSDRGKRRNFPQTQRAKHFEALAAIHFNHCDYGYFYYFCSITACRWIFSILICSTKQIFQMIFY